MARKIDIDAEINWIRLKDQGGDPAASAAGYKYAYVKSGGLYLINSAGTVTGPYKTIATDAIWDAAGDMVYATGADAATKLGIGTAYQMLRTNSGATAPEWASDGRVLLQESNPVGTNAVSLTPIAATWNDIEIVFTAKSDNVAAAVYLYLEFNADSTAGNYRYVEEYNATSAGINTGDDHIISTGIAGAGGVASSFTCGHILIPEYASSTIRKHAIAEVTNRRSAGSGLELIRYSSGLEWESTNAITRIDLTLQAGNFIAGSCIRIYGVF